MKQVSIGNVIFGNDDPFVLISGPCQLESLDHALMIGEELIKACDKNDVPYVFKASFDKANRTSVSGKRGVGIDKGLEILAAVKKELGCPVITDIHTEEQCAPVAEVVDILQIPAFLCRQTDLVVAAAKTGAVVNVKKGQFLAPWDMANVVKKIESTGNEKILLTDRGTSFGYNTLVTDFRALPQMAQTGYPVVFDATHSVQQPGGQGGSTGGQREFAPVLARAALAVGAASIFIETHEDPDNAPSDGPNTVHLSDMPKLIEALKAYDSLTKTIF